MSSKRPLLVAAVVAALAPTIPARAAAPSEEGAPAASALAVGRPCPPLRVEKFLKGEPIAAFEEGRAYVVEFWASWCAPCVQAMPHLSELQATYAPRGVTVLGVCVREMRKEGEGYVDAYDDATRARVEEFVRRQGDRMAYAVAWDGAARGMDAAFLKASGSEALPTAFVVDRRRTIAWIGHPMVLRLPLHEVAEGTWDAATGPARVKRAEDAFIGAMRLFASDAKAGLEAWDRAAAEWPILAPDLVGPKYDALVAAGAWDAADAAGGALCAEATRIRDASALNRLAWSIVDPGSRRPTRDLDLALRAADAANALEGGRDAGTLDTLARVHFLKGDVPKAIELQSRAVEIADEPMKTRLAPALEDYRKAKR